MTSLETIPADVLHIIVSYLPREEVKTTRLVSRHLERTCFDTFARTFFRKRGFMITTDSLAVLRSISKNAGIRKHLQHVWFNPDCFTFATCPCHPEDWLHMSDDHYHEQTPAKDAFAAYQADHWLLLHTARLATLLTDIFRDLPLLKTVGMRRGTDHKPHGWRTIQDEVGLDPRLLGPDINRFASAPSESSYLFVAIVKALAASQARIQRLYTDAIQLEHSMLEPPTLKEYQTALRTVRYLEINVVGIPSEVENSDATAVESHAYGMQLEHAMQSMPGLYEIGMTIFKDSKQRHMVAPEPSEPSSWRVSYPFLTMQRISGNIAFNELRRVKLEKLCITAGMLIDFLKSSSSVLMSLKLQHIQLLSEPEVDEGAPWRPVFGFLHQCSSLEYLLLHSLSCDGRTIRYTEEVDAPQINDNMPRVELYLPAVRRNIGTFTEYTTINVEEIGKQSVHDRLAKLCTEHWYGRQLFSYAMNDGIWFTDTSDEDW